MLGAFPAQVFDLHERVPTPLTTDILERTGALYAVEAEVRGQPPYARCRARQEKSGPLVDAAREVLDTALSRLSPRPDATKASTAPSNIVSSPKPLGAEP